MTERTQRLRDTVAQFDLNKHPFYTAWREGTLPLDKLDRYAYEYGAFVGLIADGWETLGHKEYAEEERFHHELWDSFSEAVAEQTPTSSRSDASPTLAETARLLFSADRSALGALYAFEVQQPTTARIKLDGLREHYKLDTKAETYFEEHADKWHEVDTLEEMIASMSDSEFEQNASACAMLSAAMWNGLDNIWYES